MRQHWSAAVAFEFAAKPRAQNDGAGQRNEPADSMHHGRPGKIMETHAQRGEDVTRAAHSRQPAVRSPSPVSNDRIDETCDTDAVKEVADESGSTDHRARCNCRAGIRKGKLEDPDRQKCDARGFVGGRRMLQEEPVISDEPVAVAEHESEADGIEEATGLCEWGCARIMNSPSVYEVTLMPGITQRNLSLGIVHSLLIRMT